mmetsp:Transcript_22731/g.34747  ORF Transcript_22731/g.34747 Transcript_22731/m.34747 type:complete len:148 (+) Transcript_22731:80-523(+)
MIASRLSALLFLLLTTIVAGKAHSDESPELTLFKSEASGLVDIVENFHGDISAENRDLQAGDLCASFSTFLESVESFAFIPQIFEITGIDPAEVCLAVILGGECTADSISASQDNTCGFMEGLGFFDDACIESCNAAFDVSCMFCME